MRYETVTFTVRYPAFDEGERVVVRDTGEVGVVERFHAPSHLQDDAIVFLRGKRTGISASECDPYRDPDLPVVRTLEHAEEMVAVWIETPAGEQFMCDEVLGWTRFEAARRPTYHPSVADAVRAAADHAASMGFASVQHHPL